MSINATTSMVPTPLRATTTFNIGRQQVSQNVFTGRLVDTFLQTIVEGFNK